MLASPCRPASSRPAVPALPSGARPRPKRLMVTWNGSGRPSARRASTSPSRITELTGRLATAATTPGRLADTSRRLRVYTRTSPPDRCTCTRAPSYLVSTDAIPVRCRAASTSGAVPASIGSSGRNRVSRKPRSAAAPPSSAAAPTAASEPDTMRARRTSAASTSAAAASASAMMPSRAPWRSSPTIRRRRNSCSASVAPANSRSRMPARRAVDPGPALRANSAMPAATCGTVSEASAAAGISVLRSAA